MDEKNLLDTDREKIGLRIYLGVFLISLSILMLEIALTRIFSVTMWYHFSFMAISLALFGLGASGIYVYIFQNIFIKEKIFNYLFIFSIFFSLAILFSFIFYLQFPNVINKTSLKGILQLGMVYLVIALPFFFGGLCISLLLTRYSSNISKIYFSDLFGAGVGCVLLILLLKFISGPSCIIAISIFACCASIIFSSFLRNRIAFLLSTTVGLILVCFLTVNIKGEFLRIDYSKLGKEENKIYEKWNPYSRIAVFKPDEKSVGKEVAGWGLSDRFNGYKPKQYGLIIDGGAGTPITEFDGDLKKVEHVKYDVTSIAYFLKDNAKVLIIGPGGGRDVLTALVFNQRKIYPIEVNYDIIKIVKEKFGDFTHHLYNYPNVHLKVDEARSFITNSKEHFDIIQASLIDTWAASSAGAFVLTENNLYTKEAFIEYFYHLSSDGILTMSRWFIEKNPYEAMRLVALGAESWRSVGIKNPKLHIILVKKKDRRGGLYPGVGTIILKRSPFLLKEIRKINEVSQEMGFEVILSPITKSDSPFERIFGGDREKFYRSLPVDISPPTDDKPFFFYMLRIKDFFRRDLIAIGGGQQGKAIFILGSLLLIVFALVMLFIFGPLLIFEKNSLNNFCGNKKYLFYFACLGIGFMLVEIPLIQKFILFLGHPIYSLSVVLFSLLIFTGFGSFLTNRFRKETIKSNLVVVLLGIVILLIFYIFFLSEIFRSLIGLEIPYRILISVCFILPLGLLMGMPFPMGIKLLRQKSDTIIPWVWGVNGATSVFSSVLAIVIAITYGFSFSLIIGQLVYLTAFFIIQFSKL